MNPINVTGYDRAERAARAELEQFHQRPGGHRKMKIHVVEVAGAHDRLVKAHTRAGAEKFVRDSIKPEVTARIASQDDLVRLLQDGIEIEDATNSPQASIPEPDQKPE